MARVVVKPSLAGPLARLRKLNNAIEWMKKRMTQRADGTLRQKANGIRNWNHWHKNDPKYWIKKPDPAAAKEVKRLEGLWAKDIKVLGGLVSVRDEQNDIVKTLRKKVFAPKVTTEEYDGDDNDWIDDLD